VWRINNITNNTLFLLVYMKSTSNWSCWSLLRYELVRYWIHGWTLTRISWINYNQDVTTICIGSKLLLIGLLRGYQSRLVWARSCLNPSHQLQITSRTDNPLCIPSVIFSVQFPQSRGTNLSPAEFVRKLSPPPPNSELNWLLGGLYESAVNLNYKISY
jgi:hypothetical protein